MKARKGMTSGMFEVSRYTTVFFKLSKILRPSSTPITIDAKSSSKRIISAASFVTSLPVMFIEIPSKITMFLFCAIINFSNLFTDISLFDSRRVIDTITCDSTHKPFSLAGLHDLEFLSWRGSCEYTVRFLHPTTQVVELILAFFFFSF